MPTAALLRSFSALARPVLHGTFRGSELSGLMRPIQALARQRRILQSIFRAERGGATGKAVCVAHS